VQPIVTPAEMYAIDAAAPEPVEVLIARAGRAAASAAVEMLGGTYGRTVNAIVGPGNNGADGRVAAALLRRRGVRVREFELAAIGPDTRLPEADLVIDAAFGTGFRGEWPSPGVGDALVLAVDIPSGLDATTGIAGQGVLRADRTVTFQALKPGLVLSDGPALAGEITIAEIGLDVSGASSHRVERGDAAAWWPTRPSDAHKWRSALRIVAGSPAMLGAARLCAAAAARSGSGLVSLSSPGADPGARAEIVQPRIPLESWAQAVLADLDRYSALAVGPGLGRSPATTESVVALVAAAGCAVVIDGDGISAFAADLPAGRASLASRDASTVITPHDREFEILTGARPGPDRIAAVRDAAGALGCTILLKGPATIVAAVDGTVLVVDHGDQRLATAGSGDVLTGMIGAALAAGTPPLEAAAASAWLHAEAAHLGPTVGLLAGDLVDLLPRAVAGLK
jgi:NAD(P)H-hydrate epimerase